jgi:hypothetical protein
MNVGTKIVTGAYAMVVPVSGSRTPVPWPSFTGGKKRWVQDGFLVRFRQVSATW